MQIAVVTPDLRVGGGVAEKALFVARTLRDQLGAEVRMISLATSRADASSRLLTRPWTWACRGYTSFLHEEFVVEHVGADGVEIEAGRYRPRRLLQRRLSRCDVVHVVAGTPAWAWSVSGFPGPIVVHFASFARHERASRNPAWYSPVDGWRRLMTGAVTAIERIALRRAAVIITLNDTRRREAEVVVGPGRHVATVHTGVDTDWFTPGCPYAGDGCLLTVGRLDDPRKNVPLLLRAYAAARARSSNVPRLVLAGYSAPSDECWRLVTRLGLDGCVEYRGPLDRVQLAALYRQASAFVLSSDEEGQGIVLLEAMASGLPIVSTSCIGPQELVTDGCEGLLVPVRAIAPLAQAIVRLGDDRHLRERLSRAARLRAEREFAFRVTGARLCAVYQAAGIIPGVQHAPAGERTAMTANA